MRTHWLIIYTRVVILDVREPFSHLTLFAISFNKCTNVYGHQPCLRDVQCKLNKELPGILTVTVDIIIIREGDVKKEAIQDHDTKLWKCLNRCLKQHIRLLIDKLKLKRPEVPSSDNFWFLWDCKQTLINWPENVKLIQQILGAAR